MSGSNTSFTQKKIDVTFHIGGPNTTPGARGNTIISSGMRVLATITQSGMMPPRASLRIFGMSLGAMQQLSTIGLPPGVATMNQVYVNAGDASGTSQVFMGEIMTAYADLSGAPESSFEVTATTAFMAGMKSVPPTSFSGLVDVATIMSTLAPLGGFGFVNYGVSGIMLSTSYLRGTAMDQIRSAAAHADINFAVENNVLSIWPKYGTRGGAIPLVSKTTGMVGSPRWSNNLIAVDMEFNPQLMVGQLIEVQSIIKPACGQWAIQGISHRLEAEVQSETAAWFTTVECWTPIMASAMLLNQNGS